ECGERFIPPIERSVESVQRIEPAGARRHAVPGVSHHYGSRFMSAQIACGERPRQLQIADVGGIDLRQAAVAGARVVLRSHHPLSVVFRERTGVLDVRYVAASSGLQTIGFVAAARGKQQNGERRGQGDPGEPGDRSHGTTTTPHGRVPAGIAAGRVREATSTTETSLESPLAVNSRAPSGVTSIPHGRAPTSITASSRFVVASTTETVLERPLATYTHLPSGEVTTPTGRARRPSRSTVATT